VIGRSWFRIGGIKYVIKLNGEIKSLKCLSKVIAIKADLDQAVLLEEFHEVAREQQ
jgi:hypothetical protein